MDKQAIVAIADGLKQIEDGVEKIQGVMRAQNIKSIKDVAAELIPILKQNDDEINESIIRHLEKQDQVKGFAPNGMLECWNIGKLGLGILDGWVNDQPKAG